MRGDKEPPGFAALRQRQQGVVSRSQALRFFSSEQITHRLESHRWVAMHRGVYLTRPRRPGDSEWEWCALLAAGVDRHDVVCLGGLSALRVWGLRRIEPATIDVIVTENRRATLPPRATLRRTSVPPHPDHLRLTRPPTTMPARSLVDAVRWARSDREAMLIITSCFRQRLVGLAEVLVEAKRRGRRQAILVATATDAAGGSHTLDEIGFLDICRRFRLPLPQRQVRYADAEGRTRFLDAIYEEYKIVAEINGAGHDDDVEQNLLDADRRIEWELKGFTFIPFPNIMIRREPAKVAQRLRKALVDGGWSA